MMVLDKKEACAEMGRRSGGAKRYKDVWMVEGESLNRVQIAARLGISPEQARRRMRHVLDDGRALTWKALGLKDEA